MAGWSPERVRPAEAGPVAAGRPAALRRALAAPWVHLTRPQRAAACLAAAPRGAFWACFALHGLGVGLLVLLLALWNGTIRLDWTTRSAPPAPARAAFSVRPGVPAPALVERSIADVWRDWHARTSPGPAELAFILAILAVAAATACLAWLNLPRVYRSGPVLRSYGRAFRAAASCAGLVTLLVAAFGGALVAANRWSCYRLSGLRAAPNLFFDLEGLLVVLAPAAGCLVLAWLGQAVQGAAEGLAEPRPAWRCEGCGYDLRHHPAEARCPECGLSVWASRRPHRRRPCAWEARGGLGGWLATELDVLGRPHHHYWRLKLRGDSRRAARFAAWNYVSVGVGGAGWICALGLHESLLGGGPADLAGLAALFLFATPLACWVAHRALAAAVASFWMATDYLPDGAWAARVIAYESAFIWVLCGFWGLLFTSFLAGGEWVTRLVGPQLGRGTGAPLELVLLGFGTLALLALWLWRYRTAGRAVRWSNY